MNQIKINEIQPKNNNKNPLNGKIEDSLLLSSSLL